jgi:hypothetical protein
MVGIFQFAMLAITRLGQFLNWEIVPSALEKDRHKLIGDLSESIAEKKTLAFHPQQGLVPNHKPKLQMVCIG